MRRSNLHHNINRNSDTAINDVNTNPMFVNTVDPDYIGSQNWQRYDKATGVDIIEINDSDISETSDETPTHNLNHAWSYVYNTRLSKEQDKYRTNAKARERRRLINDAQQRINVDPAEYVHNNSKYFDNIDVSEHDSKNVRLNHQINCFTIINKHFINSDTSSENIDYDHELNRPMGDALENTDYYNLLEDEMITYNHEYDAEKKTIWIYSFKNKHLLSDECFELVNIPSKDTESSTSFSLEKLEKDNLPRVASPIPSTYIPRLDLSLGQTLSTVTEITEPGKQPSSIETDRSAKVPVTKKPENSWVVNKHKDNDENVDKKEKSTNIVNWMALSPRERRRIFRGNSGSDVVFKGKLATLQEVCPSDDKKTPNVQDKIETIETYKDIQSTTVDVDVHAALPEPTETFKNIYKDPIRVISHSDIEDFIEKENIGEVKIIETIQEVNMCSRKPQIKVNPKCTINVKSITDPIEKLNSDNWIADEGEQQTPTYNSHVDRDEEISLSKRENKFTESDRLWSKNALALMKPAQWNEYAPIGDSILSLHLSLDTTFKKQTCFTRLINLFRCCK